MGVVGRGNLRTIRSQLRLPGPGGAGAEKLGENKKFYFHQAFRMASLFFL